MNFGSSTVLMQGARDYQEDALLSHFPYGAGHGFCVLADGMAAMPAATSPARSSCPRSRG